MEGKEKKGSIEMKRTAIHAYIHTYEKWKLHQK